MDAKFNILKHLLLVLFCIPLMVQAAEFDRNDDREQLKKVLYSIEESLNNLEIDALLSYFDDQAVVAQCQK